MILKEKRIEKELTQQQVADAVGVSISAISFYENKQRSPRPTTAKKLGKLLNFNWTDFYKEESDEQLQAKENVERQSTAET